MIQREAIYGTVGIAMYDHTGYPLSGYGKTGWAAPSNDPVEVDFAGHSWFMTKAAVKEIYSESEDFRAKYKYVGEDAYISYINLKLHGTPTVVPPHYTFDQSTWGSIWREFGTEEYAVSRSSENMNNMTNCVKDLANRGWDLMESRVRPYIDHIIPEQHT